MLVGVYLDEGRVSDTPGLGGGRGIFFLNSVQFGLQYYVKRRHYDSFGELPVTVPLNTALCCLLSNDLVK